MNNYTEQQKALLQQLVLSLETSPVPNCRIKLEIYGEVGQQALDRLLINFIVLSKSVYESEQEQQRREETNNETN